MVKLLAYGYANAVVSSRKLERATYRDVAVRMLCADQHPDHWSIARQGVAVQGDSYERMVRREAGFDGEIENMAPNPLAPRGHTMGRLVCTEIAAAAVMFVVAVPTVQGGQLFSVQPQHPTLRAAFGTSVVGSVTLTNASERT